MSYHRDKAIRGKDEDKLERSSFAQQIAEDVFNTATSEGEGDSIVFGLIGEWGSGKSSILRLISSIVEEKIAVQNNDFIPDSSRSVFFNLMGRPDFEIQKVRVEQIWFDSWLPSSHPQLVSQYLNLVESKLSKYDSRLSSLLRKYSDLIVSAFENESKLGFLSKMLRFFSSRDDLRKTKDEINRKLVENDVHLIVFVDDTDRMIGNRVAEFVQFIAATVDFDNTVFVIAYNEGYVKDALRQSGMRKQFADEFLSKVVQVPIAVPKIGATRMDSLFKNLVVEGLGSRGIVIDIRDDVRDSLLNNFLKSIRDLKLFSNALLARKNLFSKGLNHTSIAIISAFELYMPDVVKIVFSNFNSFMYYLNSFKEDEGKITREFGEQNAKRINDLLRYINVSSDLERYPITNEVYYYWYFSDFEYEVDKVHQLIIICKQVSNGDDEKGNKEKILRFFESLHPIKIFSFRRDFNKYFEEAHDDKKRKEAELCLRAILKYFKEFDYTGVDIFERNSVIQVQLDYILRCLFLVFSETVADEIPYSLNQFVENATEEAVLYMVFWLVLNNKVIKQVYPEFYLPEAFWTAFVRCCSSAICKWHIYEVEQIWSSVFLLQFKNHDIDWNSIPLSDFNEKESANNRAISVIKSLFGLLKVNRQEGIGNEKEIIASAYQLFVPVSNNEKVFYVRVNQFNSYAVLAGEDDLFNRRDDIRELLIKCVFLTEKKVMKKQDFQLLALDKFINADSSEREMMMNLGITIKDLSKYYEEIKKNAIME